LQTEVSRKVCSS